MRPRNSLPVQPETCPASRPCRQLPATLPGNRGAGGGWPGLTDDGGGLIWLILPTPKLCLAQDCRVRTPDLWA